MNCVQEVTSASLVCSAPVQCVGREREREFNEFSLTQKNAMLFFFQNTQCVLTWFKHSEFELLTKCTKKNVGSSPYNYFDYFSSAIQNAVSNRSFFPFLVSLSFCCCLYTTFLMQLILNSLAFSVNGPLPFLPSFVHQISVCHSKFV